jgi:hypothetical protein
VSGLALAIVGLWVITQTTYGPLATKLGLLTSSSPAKPPNANPPPSIAGPPSAAGGGGSMGPGGSNTGNP